MSSVVVLSNRIPELIAALPAAASEAVAKAAIDVEARAKANVPPRVDTGAMMNSITAEQESALSWLVSCLVSYGIYHEMGTYKMSAHPFMVPAAEAIRPQFEASFGEIFS